MEAALEAVMAAVAGVRVGAVIEAGAVEAGAGVVVVLAVAEVGSGAWRIWSAFTETCGGGSKTS